MRRCGGQWHARGTAVAGEAAPQHERFVGRDTVVAILFARGLTRVVQRTLLHARRSDIAARATSSCRAQIKGLGVSVPSSA